MTLGITYPNWLAVSDQPDGRAWDYMLELRRRSLGMTSVDIHVLLATRRLDEFTVLELIGGESSPLPGSRFHDVEANVHLSAKYQLPASHVSLDESRIADVACGVYNDEDQGLASRVSRIGLDIDLNLT